MIVENQTLLFANLGKVRGMRNILRTAVRCEEIDDLYRHSSYPFTLTTVF